MVVQTYLTIFLSLVCLISGSNILFRSVEYPIPYDPASTIDDTYIQSRNLMYRFMIYDNGTLFSVGNSSNPQAVENNLEKKMIFTKSITMERLEMFKIVVVDSGLIKLPSYKNPVLSGLVCYIFNNDSTTHQVCFEDKEIMDNSLIELEIKSLLEDGLREFRPPVFFLESKLMRFVGGKKVNFVSSVADALDPTSVVLKKNLRTDDYVDENMNVYSTFWEAVTTHTVYSDSHDYVQFIGYVQDISVNGHKEVENTSHIDLSFFKVLFGVIIVIVLAIVLIVVVLTCRKNQEKDFEFGKVVNEISDSESDSLGPIPNYPDFLVENEMNKNHPTFSSNK